MVPLHKRGDREIAGNYRGISLLCSAYKVYAEILRNRLEIEVERKNLIPESQTGFRKGRSTLEYICIESCDAKGNKARRRGWEGIYFLCGFEGCFAQGEQKQAMGGVTKRWSQGRTSQRSKEDL